MSRKRTQMEAEDKAAIDLMLEAQALVPIVPRMLPNKGWGINYCPDGDVAPSAINQYFNMIRAGHGHDPCLNQLPVFGGPAACSAKSPFHQLTLKGKVIGSADDFILSLVEGMLRVKNKGEDRIAHMAYMPHCSCGMCNANGVRVWDNVLWTVEWKMRMRQEFGKTFTNHKVFPVVDYHGYPEEAQHEDGIAIVILNRGKFERLAQQQNWG